ncbi:hypothetical protein NHL50_01350 [Acidimicrobiia bacterium EGI L10123]|uniref:hypothetical protein n=1 Tax=Salinilacustrithrix flava TaxID=2957203 RepID=UPI003D7C1FDD|nr:hypothetical protein [Acidimicrobiia bacterium EGI L10123]
MIAPRFDSPILQAMNALTIAAFLYVGGLFIWSWRKGRQLQWRDLLILVHFSIAGCYVPVFPLIWLAKERGDSRMPTGKVDTR